LLQLIISHAENAAVITRNFFKNHFCKMYGLRSPQSHAAGISKQAVERIYLPCPLWSLLSRNTTLAMSITPAPIVIRSD